jgi:hypothetical protein
LPQLQVRLQPLKQKDLRQLIYLTSSFLQAAAAVGQWGLPQLGH